MASNRAVLIDLDKHGLDPTKPHNNISDDGHLKSRKQPVLDVEVKSTKLPDVVKTDEPSKKRKPKTKVKPKVKTVAKSVEQSTTVDKEQVTD